MKLSIYVVVLFLLITVGTASYESNADGYNQFGYPLIFYQHTAGKSIEPIADVNWFNTFYLITDILIVVAIVLFARAVVRLSRKIF